MDALSPVTVCGVHWLQTLVLGSPLVYINEGLRAALTTSAAYVAVRGLSGADRIPGVFPRAGHDQLPAAGDQLGRRPGAARSLLIFEPPGGVAERSIARLWKTAGVGQVPRGFGPPPPPLVEPKPAWLSRSRAPSLRHREPRSSPLESTGVRCLYTWGAQGGGAIRSQLGLPTTAQTSHGLADIMIVGAGLSPPVSPGAPRVMVEVQERELPPVPATTVRFARRPRILDRRLPHRGMTAHTAAGYGLRSA